jgi:hypothetical protein
MSEHIIPRYGPIEHGGQQWVLDPAAIPVASPPDQPPTLTLSEHIAAAAALIDTLDGCDRADIVPLCEQAEALADLLSDTGRRTRR